MLIQKIIIIKKQIIHQIPSKGSKSRLKDSFRSGENSRAHTVLTHFPKLS